MTEQGNSTAKWKLRNRHNQRNLALWTLAWLFSLALVRFGASYWWAQSQGVTLVLLVINVLIGLGMIRANKIQLQGLDELQQRIQLEAMGISLGVGLVAGVAYGCLETTGLIGGKADIAHLIILMGVTYLVALLVGVRKYQ